MKFLRQLYAKADTLDVAIFTTCALSSVLNIYTQTYNGVFISIATLIIAHFSLYIGTLIPRYDTKFSQNPLDTPPSV